MPVQDRRESILAVRALAGEETLDELAIRHSPNYPQRMQCPDLPEGLTGRFPRHETNLLDSLTLFITIVSASSLARPQVWGKTAWRRIQEA